MSSWLLSLTISAALVCQSGTPDSETQQLQIRAAIQKLASPEFATRKEAHQFLWKQGLAAEPALRQALKSARGETRLHARRLLRDFDYGILPGVPVETTELIRRFRDGGPVEQQLAFQRLLEKNRHEIVERLIRLESNPAARRMLLERLFNDPKAIDRFVQTDRIATLIDAVGADQDARWRRATMMQLMVAPRLIERLAETKQLATIGKTIENETDAATRREMLARIFQNSTSVLAILKQDQLSFLFKLLKAEPDKAVRGQLLATMIMNPTVGQLIVEKEQLGTVITFTSAHVDAATTQVVFERLLRASAILTKILSEDGLDGIVKLAKHAGDPLARARLLGIAMSTTAVRQHLEKTQQYNLVIKFAEDESNKAARHEYLKALLQTSNIVYGLRNSELIKRLWDLVKADQDKAWRASAVRTILASYRANSLLHDKQEVEWVLQILQEDAAPADRVNLLTFLLGNSQIQQILIGQGYFDKLLELAEAEPDPSRGRLLGSLISTPAAAQYLEKEKKLDLLLKLATGESVAAVRREYLQGLFRNYQAMQTLMKAGHFDAFFQLVSAEEDTVQRAILFGDFLQARGVLDEIIANGKVDLLLTFAEASNPQARKNYLLRLFRNQQAITLLIDKGHYDKLATLARLDKGEYLDDFLVIPKVIEQLVSQNKVGTLLDFAEKADENTRRQFLRRLFYNQTAMRELIKAKQFDRLFDLVRLEADPNWRGSLLGPLLATPDVIRHLAAAKALPKLFAILQDEKNATTRYRMLYDVVRRSETVSVLLEEGYFDTLLELVRAQPTSRSGSDLLASYLTSSKVIEYLTKHDRIGILLAFTQPRDENESVEPYIVRLFNSTAAIDALAAAGYYDDLFRLATKADDPRRRADRLNRLFNASKAIEQLINRKQVGKLLKFARDEKDAVARRNYLTRFVSNERIINALIKEGLFDDLYKLCNEEADEQTRRRQLSTLLLSSQAIDLLAKQKHLEAIIKLAMSDPDANTRKNFLNSLIARTAAVETLVERGYFNLLFDAAESNLDPAVRRQLLIRLLTTSKGASEIVRSGNTAVLMKVIAEEPNASQRSYFIQRIVSQPEAAKAILEAGGLQRLLKFVDDVANESLRRSLLSSVLFAPATLDYLQRHKKVNIVFSRVEKEHDRNLQSRCMQAFLNTPPGVEILARGEIADGFVNVMAELEDRYRSSYVSAMLSDPRLRQGWIAAGKVAALKRVVALDPNEANREGHLAKILYSPSGLLGYHLDCGDFAAAEQLLAEATGDRGLGLLSSYLLARGQLEERIALVEQRYSDQHRMDDARLLTYLHRANGDLAAARAMADAVNDPRLVRVVAVEQRDWETAAALQAQSPRPPPVPVSSKVLSEEQQRIEQLGLLAAYQRLGGQNADFDKTAEAIEHLAAAHKGNKQLAWNCAEALLLNDRFGQGLDLAARAQPVKAFRLLSFRHDYDAALDLLGWKGAQHVDQDWYDALPVDASSSNSVAQRRFDLALRVAKVLRLLGRQEDANAVLHYLESFASSRPETGSYRRRRQYYEQLAAGLYQMGLKQRVWEIGAQSVDSRATYAPNVLSYVYSTRAHEAQGWWTFFQATSPEEDVLDRLLRIEATINPSAEDPAEAFSQLAAQAIAHADTIDNKSRRSSYLHGIGTTCRLRKQWEVAEQCLGEAANSIPNAAQELAKMLAAQGQWNAAAKAFENIWKKDHEQLSALYLAGHALAQAGQAEHGAELQAKAKLLAIASTARHQLARGIAEQGLADEAAEQWAALRKTAPFESWTLNDAARRLGDHTLEADPAETAALWQHYLFGDLRPTFWFRDDESYLRLPFLIHKMRALAAIQQNDQATTRREVNLAFAAAPGDTRLAEDLIGPLESAGWQKLADEAFANVVGHYEQQSKANPGSAFFHNSLAWAAARCHRRLDEALAHAELAVQLEPQNASYLDTLAEAHFQRGDRDTAVRFSKRALELRPSDQTLVKQLQRFREAALPGDTSG